MMITLKTIFNYKSGWYILFFTIFFSLSNRIILVQSLNKGKNQVRMCYRTIGWQSDDYLVN